LRESAIRCPSVFLAIPAFIASLGSVIDPLNYNWDYAYANELPVAVEDPAWANWGNRLYGTVCWSADTSFIYWGHGNETHRPSTATSCLCYEL